MPKQIAAILLGLVAGAASWGVAGLVSDRFEPFDSAAGFGLGQLLLSLPALALGCRRMPGWLVVYLAAAWLGMNGYAYGFGGSEQRIWALLGLVTTLALLVLPAIVGLVGLAVGHWRRGAGAKGR